MLGHRFGSDVYNIYVKAFLVIREHWEDIVGMHYEEKREGTLKKHERITEEKESEEEEEEKCFRKKRTQEDHQSRRN